MAEPEILRDRGRSLEDEFFHRQNAQLKEKLQQQAKQESAREAMAQATGIKNAAVLDRLVALEIPVTTVTALSLVPLVEVAWADGSIDASERGTILERATTAGFGPGSAERTLLEEWLTRKPDPKLLTAWTQFVRGLSEQLSVEQRTTLKKDLLERARAVGSASGGFLGLGSKVSAGEAKVLEELERAFP